MRSADQTPVLDSCDLRFCWQKKRSALGKFRFFPALPKFAAKTHCPEANTDKFPSETALLNAKTAFRRFPRTKPDVPSQGLIILVTLRKNSGSVNPISPI